MSDREEYTGGYGGSITCDVLKEFWVPRTQAALSALPDILLFEAVPCITETNVILSELTPLAKRQYIPI